MAPAIRTAVEVQKIDWWPCEINNIRIKFLGLSLAIWYFRLEVIKVKRYVNVLNFHIGIFISTLQVWLLTIRPSLTQEVAEASSRSEYFVQ